MHHNELDTLIKLKYGSPLDPTFVENLPMEIVIAAVGLQTGSFLSSMDDKTTRQVLWILLRQPKNKEGTEKIIMKALIEYENRN